MLNGEHQGLALAAREALTSLVATDDSKTVVAAASAALGTEPPPPPPPPPKPPPKPPPSGWRAWLRRNHRAVLASLVAVLLMVVIAGAVALWPESTTGAIPEEDLVVAFQTDDGVRLSRVDSTNGDVDVITSVDAGNQLLYPVVSPDRRQILYLTDSPTDDHSFGKVHIMNSDGSDDRELFGDQQCEYSSRPAFSNDGKRLAVVCMGSDGRSTGLYVADADGRNLESVLDSDALSRAPTWQRNQWIIYSELETDEPTGPAVLNRVHPDGSGDTPITAVNEDGQGGASFSDLDWSSSGGLLYIKRGLSLNASNHLKPGYVYTLADGSDQPVQEGPDLAASATWSPGGQKYVEVTAQGGGLVVRTPGSDSATTIDIDPSTGLQDARPNTPAWGSR
jgi:Tol biopolymer transport system component